MAEFLQKLLSLFLAFLMTIPGINSLFNKNKEQTGDDTTSVVVESQRIINNNYEGYPLVICPGINHSPTYEYDEDGNIKKSSDGKTIGGTLIYFDNDILKEEVMNLAVPLLESIILQKNDGFTDLAYEAAKNIFSVQQTDDEGNTVNDLRTKVFDYPVSKMIQSDYEWFYRLLPVQSLSQTIGENNIYLYTFNLMGNVMQSAEGLHDYIQMVKQQTGKDKVILLNVSLGGSVFTAYADLYGSEDLAQVLNLVGAMDGSDIVADMYMRNFDVSDEYFYNDFLAMIADENMGDIAYGYLINIALRLMPKDLFRNLVTRVMDAILDTLLINTPQFWALVPKARFDECFNKYFSDDSKPVLKEKLLRYYQAQLNFEDNIRAMTTGDNAIRIDNICGAELAYGEQEYTFFNIMNSAKTVNSDGIIGFYSTSMGATGADIGTTLETYDENYTNIAHTIDISTSVLPDNTWVFCGQHHEVGRNSVVLSLAKTLITNPSSLPNNHTEGNAYPMFNGHQNDNKIRRWYFNMAKSINQTKLSPEDATELQGAIDDMEEVLNTTVADSEKADAATQRATAILIKLGVEPIPEEDSAYMPLVRTILSYISESMVKIYGHNGFSDGTTGWSEFKNSFKVKK